MGQLPHLPLPLVHPCIQIIQLFYIFFQTGDKWRHLAGFNDVLKQEENFHWLVLSFTIALIGLMILHREKLSLLCYSFVFIQKLADVFAER